MKIKFEGHKRAEAYKVKTFSGIALYSYGTKVAEVYYGWLKVYGLFSMTTRKHIGWFMKELGFDYQTAKWLYENYKIMNVETGRVKD